MSSNHMWKPVKRRSHGSYSKSEKTIHRIKHARLEMTPTLDYHVIYAVNNTMKHWLGFRLALVREFEITTILHRGHELPRQPGVTTAVAWPKVSLCAKIDLADTIIQPAFVSSSTQRQGWFKARRRLPRRCLWRE